MIITDMVLWLNKETLEEEYLDKDDILLGAEWIEVPEGATFATGDKDNFVFRKDGWYYDNQKGWWVKGDVNLQNLCKHEFVKLFWVKSDVKDNIFTLERLLGCEVLFNGRNLFVEHIVDDYHVEVVDEIYQNCVRVSDLTFFTEDGDELTLNEYVAMYYGDNCVQS